MRAISKHRQLIMGLATLWIYYYHVFPISLIAQFHTPTQAEIYFRNLGFCGVDIFLLLSAVGLYYALKSRPIKSFTDYLSYFSRRFTRVYIVLVPSTVVIALVDNWSVHEFVGKLLGIYQLWSNVYAYLWYIPCIMIFYILFPVLFMLFQRFKNKGIGTFTAILLWITTFYLLSGHIREDLYAILNRVPIFICGIYFGYLCYEDRKISGKAILFTALSLVAGIFISYQHTQYRIPEVYPCFGAALNILIAPQLVVIVAWTVAKLSAIKKDNQRYAVGNGIYRLFSILGSVSLEFYVVQEWICLKCRNSSTLLALAGHSEWGQQLECLLLTIIASMGLHLIAKWYKQMRVIIPAKKAGS